MSAAYGGSAVLPAARGGATADGEPDDEVLAAAARLGDREAFERIVHRHTTPLLRYAARALGPGPDAEDVVQEALVAGWRNLDRRDGRSSLRTWLFGILAHKITDLRRRRRPVPVDDEVLRERVVADPAGDPARHAVRSGLLDALDAALATLPERQRESWLLVEVEGMSQAEAALVLSTTPDAVRGHLYRARRALGERLRGWR